MRILVTGANGHVGCNLVRELLARQHQVVPFVRRTSNLAGLAPLGLEFAYGDILDRDSVIAAARDCQVIINLAAVYKTRGVSVAEIMEPAVTGAANVIAAAAAHEVERVIHTSSIAALGYGREPEPARTEEQEVNFGFKLPYMRAKRDSEAEARRLAEEMGVALVVLNPSGIIGRYDYAITPTTNFLLECLDGRGLTGRGSMNYVDVRDVARAHAEAIIRGVPGERYIIGGDNLEYRELGRLLGEIAEIKIRHLGAPRWLALSGLGVQNFFTRMVGRSPAVSLAEAKLVVDRHGRFDSSKAAAAFGFTPRPIGEALEDAVSWLVYRRALSPKTLARFGARFPPDPKWPALD